MNRRSCAHARFLTAAPCRSTKAAIVRVASSLAILVAVAALHPQPSLAAKKAKDLVWTHPDFAALHADRIALIPVVSFDNSLPNENLVESALGQALKGTGYRWVSGTTTRALLRAQSGGDSLLNVLRAGILAHGRLDSLAAPSIAAALNCDLMMTVRVDQWEQRAPEWNQAGKPSTSVQLRSALVDSLGRLQWSVSGSETVDGLYFDPSANSGNVIDGIDRSSSTSKGGAPSFREVLTTLFTRWAGVFPPKPAPAAPVAETASPSSTANGAGATAAAGEKPDSTGAGTSK